MIYYNPTLNLNNKFNNMEIIIKILIKIINNQVNINNKH